MYDINRTLGLQPEAFSFTGAAQSETSFFPALESPFTVPVQPAQRKPAADASGARLAASGRHCRCGQPWNCQCGQTGKSGRWIRRGRSIVIINC